MDEIDVFLGAVEEYLAAHPGESERALSVRATGSPDTIRDARRKRSLPGSVKLGRLADALHLSVDQLLGRRPIEDPPRIMEAVRADSVGDVRQRFRGFPRDLPVYGTALGHNLNFDGDGNAEIEVTLVEPTDVINRVLRPPILEGDPEAYAFYVQGDSMFPAHRPGKLRFALTRKPPQIEDDVIVQLRVPVDDGQDGEEVVAVLIKTLVKRTSEYVVLRQYNPPREFKVPREMIAKIHLVVDPGDMFDR